MRPLIEDVLDILRAIRAAHAATGSANSSDLRKQAVRSIAARELAGKRFKNLDSAEKSIHDACTRRLHLNVDHFDRLIASWLSGAPVELHSVLARVDGYADHRATVESLLGPTALPVVSPLISLPGPPSAPGTPDVAARLEVERAAIHCVAERYRSRGYSVISVEGDRVGWDLEATINGQALLRLEVKGLSADALRAELTPNEYEQMETHRPTYRVCLVTNARANPVIAEFCWNESRGGWFDDSGRQLTITPRTAAVVSV